VRRRRGFARGVPDRGRAGRRHHRPQRRCDGRPGRRRRRARSAARRRARGNGHGDLAHDHLRDLAPAPARARPAERRGRATGCWRKCAGGTRTSRAPAPIRTPEVRPRDLFRLRAAQPRPGTLLHALRRAAVAPVRELRRPAAGLGALLPAVCARRAPTSRGAGAPHPTAERHTIGFHAEAPGREDPHPARCPRGRCGC
jgi:hypothetical protein